MRKLILLAIVGFTFAAALPVMAAHPTFVSLAGATSSLLAEPVELGASDVQTASYSYSFYPRHCYCCWRNPHGRTWCSTVRAHRCWRTGGWCARH
jgi:hypothetical protein